MATVIIGIAFTALLQLLAVGTVSNKEGTELTTAVNLAGNIHEAAVRLGYDDLFDLEGTHNPAVNAHLNAVAGISGWSQVVDVSYVDENRLTLASGGLALVRTMRASGAWTALVSGGFDVFTSRIAAMLGFQENRANRLIEEKGHFTGLVAEPILGRAAKADALLGISAHLGLTPADAIAVGDGANDLDMIRLAGTGVALHAKPAVAAEAKVRIDHGDLTALLYLQGYRREEFAA